MSKRVSIDFETFSQADLKAVGAPRYAQDPSTEVLSLAYQVGDKAPRLWYPGMAPPKKLFKAIRKGRPVFAFNTLFEISIWKWVCVQRMGWPEVPLNQWRDTQAAAAYFSLPQDLDTLARVLKVQEQKDAEGHRVMMKLARPRNPSAKDPSTRWVKEGGGPLSTVPQDFEKLYKYNVQDVRVEVAVAAAMPGGLPARELEVWRETIRQNLAGLPVDLDLVRGIVKVLNKYADRVADQVKELTKGQVDNITQLERMTTWTRSKGYEIPSWAKADVDHHLAQEDIPAPVRRLLELRKAGGKSSVKKFVKLLEATGEDGKIRGCLRYHHAGTGRWAGALLQPHNLPRAVFVKDDDPANILAIEQAVLLFKAGRLKQVLKYHPDPITAASCLIRPAIYDQARPFRVSDYSGIENRVVLWLAGDKETLEKIKAGVDLYKDMAAALYDVLMEAVTKAQRFHGKETVLGCGYGMGWEKFQAACLAKGLVLSDEEAQRTIKIFRRKYKKLVELWYALEDCCRAAIKNPGQVFRYLHLAFQVDGKFLVMVLPNGKRVHYPEPRLEMRTTPWGERKLSVTHAGMVGPEGSKKWGREVLTPGRITENAAQAVSREIMVDGMFNLTAAGYQVLMTVHDESVSQDPLGRQGSQEEVSALMVQVDPKVYKGLPLHAVTFTSNRYRK